ncbi:MAG: GAF domain-containing protein [Desulfobacterales bacterium]|nr:GAF domain-containing protein [Desulfobacterales bacterium]
MGSNILGNDIHAKVSLEPLLDFWEKKLVPKCSHMETMYGHIKERFDQTPELKGDIEDIGVLNKHYDILQPLMTAVFPPATFEKEISGALTPCTFEPFFVSPEFQRIFLDNDNFVKSVLEKNLETEINKKRLKLYLLILERIYGIRCQRLEKVDIKVVPDQETGLSRYFGITADFQFIRIRPLSPPPELTDEDENRIYDNITDLNILKEYIDLDQYEFTGLNLVRAIDVTESEVISALERDLIDQHSIFSSDGIALLEKRLQTLFQRPDMHIGIAALQGEQVMIIKNDCDSNINCLFSNSQHINLADIEGSIWVEAAKGDGVMRVADLALKPDLLPAEEQAAAAGIRSMLLSPLSYQGEIIGLLEVFTGTPNDLGPVDTMLLQQVVPIFSVALKRGLDDMDKHIQSIIKEKCTAVHPSVEWRFEQAAISHMERVRQGNTASEMEPIIFKDVIPFYGQSDIRGSSLARNKGIQKDLTHQLNLAHGVMEASSNHRSWPILQEFKYRIQTKLDQISKGVTSSDENAVFTLLKNEIGPSFEDLKTLGPDVADKINAYENALDPVAGMVYDKRKDYEESVFQVNQALSAYLEQEDSLIQKDFPHYFEKRQTDGVDYMMYIGASMNKNQRLARFHVQDMTLWQLMLACGLAWHTEQLKPRLKVPLDTCHLILVNHTPLSIRFRFDEKRFDVDGAYDVRHEIIKSRLDKALVKKTGERLTQPGRIAVVYSNPAEGREIRQHIEFMTTLGKLNNDMEFLELDDMPDVRGLKAIRVGVDIAAQAGNVVEMRAG